MRPRAVSSSTPAPGSRSLLFPALSALALAVRALGGGGRHRRRLRARDRRHRGARPLPGVRAHRSGGRLDRRVLQPGGAGLGARRQGRRALRVLHRRALLVRLAAEPARPPPAPTPGAATSSTRSGTSRRSFARRDVARRRPRGRGGVGLPGRAARPRRRLLRLRRRQRVGGRRRHGRRRAAGGRLLLPQRLAQRPAGGRRRAGARTRRGRRPHLPLRDARGGTGEAALRRRVPLRATLPPGHRGHRRLARRGAALAPRRARETRRGLAPALPHRQDGRNRARAEPRRPAGRAGHAGRGVASPRGRLSGRRGGRARATCWWPAPRG